MSIRSLPSFHFFTTITLHPFLCAPPAVCPLRFGISIKRLAVMLYALGHGHLTPQDALEQYEANHGQTYVFELEEGGRAPSGADRSFERAIQTCPCILCLPCFR